MTNKTLLMTTTLRIPLFIWTDHPHPRQRSKLFAILRRSFLRLLSVTAVSGFLVCGKPTAEYLSRLGIARKTLIEFPYWVDVPNDWTPPGRCVDGNADSGPLRLIAIGRLAVVKQFEVAIRALARVNQQGQPDVARLTIAGDGPEKRTLQALAAYLKVEHAVSFAGWLETQEVKSALRASDALLITSRFDAYGVAVLEALAEGRPILASDTVIAAVDRSDGTDAIQMHMPGDDQMLAQQILSLANNREQLRHASFAARAIAEKWPPERAGAIIKQIQSELINGAMPIGAQIHRARTVGPPVKVNDEGIQALQIESE